MPSDVFVGLYALHSKSAPFVFRGLGRLGPPDFLTPPGGLVVFRSGPAPSAPSAVMSADGGTTAQGRQKPGPRANSFFPALMFR
jgi:hypothetical protein